MSKKFYWPVLILVSAVAAGLFSLSDAARPIRPVILFWFFLVCPGMSIIRLVRIEDRVTELVLAAALSLAIEITLAEVMVLTRLWSPAAGMVVLVGICLIGASLQILDASKNKPGMEDNR